MKVYRRRDITLCLGVLLLSVFVTWKHVKPKPAPIDAPSGEVIGALPSGALIMFIDNENGVVCYSYLASISCVRLR